MSDNSQKKIPKKNSGQDNKTYINMKEEIQLIQNLGDFLGDTKNITTILDTKIQKLQELQKKQKELDSKQKTTPAATSATSAETSAATPVVQTKNIIRVMNWNIKFDLYYKNLKNNQLKSPNEQKDIRNDLSKAIYTQNPDIVCTQEMSLIDTTPNQIIFDKTQNIFVGQDTNKKFKKKYNIVSIDAGKNFLGIVYNNTLFKEVSKNNRIAYCSQQDKNGLLTGNIDPVNLINNNSKFNCKNCGRGIVSILLQYKTDRTKYLGIINVHLPHTNSKNNKKFVTELEETINAIKKKYLEKNNDTKFILLGDFNEYLDYSNNNKNISKLTLINDTKKPTLHNSNNQVLDLQYTDLKNNNIKVSKKIQSDHYYVLSELEFP